MRKNILGISCVFLMVFIVLMVFGMPSVALASNYQTVSQTANEYAPISNNELANSAKSAYLADYETGTVIYQKNPNEKLPIASMVKIMTSLLTLEAVDSGKIKMDDMVVVSAEAAGMGGSQVFLDANSKHKLSDLIKCIVVASANDASVAVAEYLGGSEGAFVTLMNKRANELGMTNTHFSNCTGLPAPENFSCAKDVFTMTRELVKHPQYFNYSRIWLEDYAHPDGRKTTITNTNKLVRFYNGCDGGKTGFTSEARFCLSATAKRGGMRIMAVIIGVDNSKVRFAEVSKMLNYAFGNYENRVLLANNAEIENTVEVIRGKSSVAKIVAEKNICAFLKRGEESKYELKYELPEVLKAPLKRGDVVGKIVV
ncbi:MAG TPA: D-alanyl-D-alanine carboxypeptidase family protein, partial [Clostridia bacterium]|nr:D-alanyl-D-alanine carboxypeptidase family protein [Clostridia bacterium]